MKKVEFLVLVITAILWSCEKPAEPTPVNEIPPPTEQIIVSKNISTGTYTEVSNTTIATSGSTIKIAKPNTPVDGVELIVPANSFTAAPNLKVGYAEIKSHQFGANFNPISPVITVSCDGGYSKELMAITIPVKVPAGHIPLGFYLDETTGKLEGIPVKNYTSTSITLLTRHFLPGSKLKNGQIGLKAAASIGASIIISSIAESVLYAQPLINSGFKPGTDDWEFVNYGSYIAPGGHCAGQNMAAMWYYYEKKPTEGSLFNKYSDNPKLWQDNARGYKFCSVIHNDLDWEGTVSTLFDKYIDKNQSLDKLKLQTIAGIMLVTGEPQGIGIYRQTGSKSDGTPIYGGHDLICYQVSVSGGKLYISDPNTPGEQQTINFSNDKFSPYNAKLNGHDSPKSYPFVTYYAKTAYIEWDKIGKRWGELGNNTIGTIAPNTFPDYTLWAKTGAGFELKEGLTVTSDTLRTIVICPTAEISFNVKNQKLIGHEIFDKEGNAIAVQEGNGSVYVKLKPGLTKLGYYIVGWKESSKNSEGSYFNKYIDFKWITVNYSPLSITPNPFQGISNKEYTFIARSMGTAPKTCKYTWDFGDGGGQYPIQNDSIVTHAYSKEGIYTITVKLYDSANKLVSEASASATIKTGIPPPEISLISMSKATIGNDSVLIAGDVLYISGWNFGSSKCSNCKVLFNGKEATNYVSWSNSAINVCVPMGATSGNVEVVVENQKSNAKPLLITDIWKFILLANRFDYKLNRVKINYKNSKGVSDAYTIYDLTDPDVKPTYSITGSKLLLNYNYQPNNNRKRTIKIEGTLSTDGATITDLKYDEVDIMYPNTKEEDIEKISFTITELTLLYWQPKLTSFTIQYLPVNGNTTYLQGKLTNFKYSYKDSFMEELNIENIVSIDSSTAEFILAISKE